MLFIAARGFSQDGNLDTTFATNGILMADLAEGTETIQEIIQQPDGKLVAVMSSNYPESFDIQVVRMNADGSLDSTFATGGAYRKRSDIGADLGYDIELLSDGSFLVAGSFGNENADDTDLQVFKLTSAGVLDSLFGTDGSTVIKVDSSEDYANALAVADNGDIYLAGTSKVSGFAYYRNVVAKVTADGSVDSTFGSSGVYLFNTDVPNTVYSSELQELVIMDDGNLLASGSTTPSSTNRISLYKILSDGSGLDTSFGNEGEVLAPLEGSGYGMVLHPNGTIFVTGGNIGPDGYDLVVAAFDTTGTAKADFGTFGVATVNYGINDVGMDIAVQPDGKLVIGGESGGTFFQGPPRAFFSTRMDTTGMIDTTWGEAGTVLTPTSDRFAFANSVLVQQDGKIVLAGSSSTNTTLNDFTVIRYGNFIDADGDGYSVADDCNDFAATVYPGADEIIGNGIDEDCNGEDALVAVREPELARQFEVFPNPVPYELHLLAPAGVDFIGNVEIYSVAGALLRTYATPQGVGPHNFDVTNLPAGVLLLRFATDRGAVVKRVIKR